MDLSLSLDFGSPFAPEYQPLLQAMSGCLMLWYSRPNAALWELGKDGKETYYTLKVKKLTRFGIEHQKEKVLQNEMKCQLKLPAKDGALHQRDMGP
jgi:hypothetical protein